MVQVTYKAVHAFFQKMSVLPEDDAQGPEVEGALDLRVGAVALLVPI
jgi:hypothetical protein